MRLIDEQFLETSYYGARLIARHLRRQGYAVGRKRISRLMKLMGLSPIYQKQNTSKSYPQHKVYPYLLRGLTIDNPNHVWCVDVTSIPMRRGFRYMDWATRKVLSGGGSIPRMPISTLLPCSTLWAPRDFQHRSGQPVYQLCVHRSSERGRHQDLDGRQRALDGQCHDREALAVFQVRMNRSQCVRNRKHGENRNRPLD